MNRDNDASGVNTFSERIGSLSLTSLDIASVLTIFAAGVSSGQPLPSSVTTRQWAGLSSDSGDRDMRDISNLSDPGSVTPAIIDSCPSCALSLLRPTCSKESPTKVFDCYNAGFQRSWCFK
jgi:hypothetical protein